MEAVHKRPQRQKVAKKPQKAEVKDAAWSFSDDEEKAAVQAAIAELDAFQEPITTEREIRRNEEDLMALLLDGEMPKEQELLVAEGAGSQPPPNNHNSRGGESDHEKITEQEKSSAQEEKSLGRGAVEVQDRVNNVSPPLIPVVHGAVSAPSAPVFEEDEEDSRVPLVPKPSAPPPPPPIRPSMPRAFHEITIPAGNGTAVPSAPPDFADGDVGVDHSSTTPSAPSLSPTASKKLHRVVASPRNPEKLRPVVRMPAKAATVASEEGASETVRNSFAKSHQTEKKAGMHSIYPSMPQESSKTAASATVGEADGAQASYEQLLKKKHIRVKLEPFINYEMNLMRAEASQKRQEMKMRHIETNKGELYKRVERYLLSEYILHNAASTMDEYKQKIDVLVKKGKRESVHRLFWL